MGKNILAVNGGEPLIKRKMPPRFALGEAERRMINEVIDYYSSKGEDPPYQGHYEELFCDEFCKYMGGGYADAVCSGTVALYVALKALELPAGSEVIISPVTDNGSLHAIIEAGMTPVLADSKPDSYNIGVKQFLERVTPDTRAAMIVHCAGEPVEDIELIVSEARKRGIKIIEDCSQAPGASLGGRKAGSFGDVAALSTMYRKNLTAGASSGIVYTKDFSLFEKVSAYADRGRARVKDRYKSKNPEAVNTSLNFNTDDISCAIGIVSLRRLDDTIKRRLDFIKIFTEKLSHSEACCPYNFNSGFSPFFFPVFIMLDKIKCPKKEFTKALSAEGVPLNDDYQCVISDWKYAKRYFKDDYVCENALSVKNRSFNLFLNENYTEAEADEIVRAILKVEAWYLK